MIRRALLVIALATLPAAPSRTQDALERQDLWALSLDSRSLEAARQVGVALDCQSLRPEGWVEIVATPAQSARLLQQEATLFLLQEDMVAFYAQRAAADPFRGGRSAGPNWGGGAMGGVPARRFRKIETVSSIRFVTRTSVRPSPSQSANASRQAPRPLAKRSGARNPPLPSPDATASSPVRKEVAATSRPGAPSRWAAATACTRSPMSSSPWRIVLTL